MRFSIGVTILLAQVIMIATARVHPMRYYCWAPYDSQNEYRIEATVAGRPLSPADVRQRYRILATDVNPRAIYEIVSLIEYVESNYRRDREARVQVIYRTNGGPERVWSWPPR